MPYSFTKEYQKFTERRKGVNANYIKCGDCTELLKELDDNSVDVSFTSPPYNRIRNDVYEHYDDTRTDYHEMLVEVTDELLRVTKGYAIVNIQCNHFNKSEFYRYLGKYHDKINGIVIWRKTNPRPSFNINKEHNTRSVTNGFEYFIFLKDGGGVHKLWRGKLRECNLLKC